ncbi:MAG: hypothetical protein K2K80_00525 [Clostridia bacterium]|nr:hypothetical protein [Clostridia bacterium]
MEKNNSGKAQEVNEEQQRAGKALPIIKKWAPAIISGIFSIAVPLIVNITMNYLSPIWQVIVIAIAVSAFLIISGGCWIVTAVCEARAAGRDAYDQTQKDIAKATNVLDKAITALTEQSGNCHKYAISQSIINGQKVKEMEGSVPANGNIFIQSSAFYLESKDATEEESLKPIVISNFQKGIKYHYLIPNTQKEIDDFCALVSDWYSEYCDFLFNKDRCKQLFKKSKNSEWESYYCNLIKLSKEAHDANNTGTIEELKSECLKHFLTLLSVHCSADDLFYVTVALYEKGKNDYDAIVKLPTEKDEKTKKIPYTAYQIPENEEAAFGSFRQRFINLFVDDTSGRAESPITQNAELSANWNSIEVKYWFNLKIK